MGPADGILTPDEPCFLVRVPNSSPVACPPALSGRHSESWQCSGHTCTGLLQRVRDEFNLPQSPMLWWRSWRPLSRVLDSAYFCPWAWVKQGPEALGLWWKLWVLDKKNGAILRLRLIVPFSCWIWQMWRRRCPSVRTTALVLSVQSSSCGPEWLRAFPYPEISVRP